MLLHSSSASLCSQQPAPSSTNYHKLVATLTSSGQKPYGTIPRRRRNRASSTACISSSSNSQSSPSRNSLELLPTTSSTTLPSPRPTTSSTTLWGSLKAHYFATAQSFNWHSSSSSSSFKSTQSKKTRRSADCAREFLPPLALLVANSSPVVTLDATPLILTSLEDENINNSNSTIDQYNNYFNTNNNNNSSAEEGLYPASIAAMDKFGVMRRSDNIALKTFTYRETPVVEVKRPRTPLLTQRRRPVSVPNKPAATAAIASPVAAAPVAAEEELLPLPRHLACRETRSNPDYLRMMASELRMIRARKLIAPLKPRSYLARRKELFSPVKSSLSVSMEIPCEEEDDHPLNNLTVGSWTSFSSTESFLSATSSDYATADESFD
ncbi:hypothetical protein BGZ95_004491 [Linnemannia exigua]|uniref:Uncharacterized protein n=1 Tax=Linnemannia exigua TaxID=604196 RepID=A0AAD4D2Y7_9FUNG|nr:hypothetical protein BGZ95_004491 [Linnemannia exigua]